MLVTGLIVVYCVGMVIAPGMRAQAPMMAVSLRERIIGAPKGLSEDGTSPPVRRENLLKLAPT